MASPVAKVWTQTLATGFSNRAFLRRYGGFTLIELLVVVVILAVVLASGLSLMRFGINERRTAQEGQRLMALMDFLCEQAVIHNRPLGLALARSRYAALQAPLRADAILAADPQTDGRARQAPLWQPLAQSIMASSQWSLPATMQLAVERDGRWLPLAEQVPEMPQLVCDSSGRLPAFSLILGQAGESVEFVITHRDPVSLSPGVTGRAVISGQWTSHWQERQP